jgi:hypothetical protein
MEVTRQRLAPFANNGGGLAPCLPKRLFHLELRYFFNQRRDAPGYPR